MTSGTAQFGAGRPPDGLRERKPGRARIGVLVLTDTGLCRGRDFCCASRALGRGAPRDKRTSTRCLWGSTRSGPPPSIDRGRVGTAHWTYEVAGPPRSPPLDSQPLRTAGRGSRRLRSSRRVWCSAPRARARGRRRRDRRASLRLRAYRKTPLKLPCSSMMSPTHSAALDGRSRPMVWHLILSGETAAAGLLIDA